MHEQAPGAPPEGVARPVRRLRIEGLVAGGAGIARDDGMVIFVSGSAPGDLLEAEDRKRTPDWAEARILRILEPSPLRRPAPCPVFGECGGCQWQHVAYDAQLQAKESILADAFRRLGGIEAPAPEPIVASPDEWHYRHRVQLKILTVGGRMSWGFFAPNSHRLVHLRNCWIAHRGIDAILPRLDEVARSLGVNPSSLTSFDISADGEGLRLECILHPRRRTMETGGHGVSIPWPRVDAPPLEITAHNATRLRQLPVEPGRFTFQSDGVVLSSGPGVFSQNNLALNPRLVATVVEMADPRPGDTVADVFCGVGNYSIPLARLASHVVAVENNRLACRYGEVNARAAGLDNVTFVARDAGAALAELPPGPAAVIINPPRVGAADTIDHIAALAPRRIVYVSCNPATLARDAAALARHGWHVRRLIPFDMFPQTHHLETVALFVKE